MTQPGPPTVASRVLVHAPGGRDAALVVSILAAVEIDGSIRPSLAELVEHLDAADAAILTEEALANADLRGLAGWVAAQPPWSDMPLVVLSRRGGGLERNPAAARLSELLGNVIFLERPFHATTLVSTVRSALAARRRQHQAHEALRAQAVTAERLSLATDAAEVGFWDVDLLADTLIWPPRVKAMFGISADQPVAMADFYAGLHRQDRDATVAAFVAACDPDRRALYDVEYRTVGKEDGIVRWVAAKGRGVFDEAGRCIRVVGTAIDVTARKAGETALAESEASLRRLAETLEARVQQEIAARQAAQASLAHAQRMEALGQLAGGIAHDFNNVLQAIQGGVRLIASRADDQERTRRLCKLIAEAADRGSAVTRRLLGFSRRADLRAEVMDVGAVLGGLHEILAHTLGTGITVQVSAQKGLAPVLSDRSQLETVLVNLAANARDAIGGNGVITLAAAAERFPDRDGIKLAPGAYVCISVTDTGSGMDGATLARATDPFFTTKAPGKGTGLGLSMARGFAEQSGGALAIESVPGDGTTVRLWLPVAEDADEQPATVVETSLAAPGRGSVLLVDDEKLVRQVTAEELAAAGYAVFSVESGAEALQVLSDGRAVDVLVSDLSMPVMDGVRLVREAQSRRPGLPAILLTGYVTDAADFAVSGAIDGNFTLLRKPIPGKLLAERIAVVLEGARG